MDWYVIGALYLIFLCIVLMIIGRKLGLFRRLQRQSIVRKQQRYLAMYHGGQRCIAAIPILETLSNNPDRIMVDWPYLAQTLGPVVADCPPDQKPAFCQALDALALATPHRATARQIIAMRNALLTPS